MSQYIPPPHLLVLRGVGGGGGEAVRVRVGGGGLRGVGQLGLVLGRRVLAAAVGGRDQQLREGRRGEHEAVLALLATEGRMCSVGGDLTHAPHSPA